MLNDLASTRRGFLKGASLAMYGIGLAPNWLLRAASAETAKRRKVLVAIFQRGAADGLNIVAPYGEKRYYELRPDLALRPPASAAEGAIVDLDGFFGFHPSLAPLKPLFDRKALAVIHAAGSPDPSRSHFDAQGYMESGTPGRKSTRDGWLNRALGALPGGDDPLRAVAIGQQLPRTLQGPNPALAVADLRTFAVRNPAAESVFDSMYGASGNSLLSGLSKEAFEATSIIRSIERQPYTPANNAVYPNDKLGRSLVQVAQLIKAGVGLEAAFADVGGWDHHFNEVAAAPHVGQLANLLDGYGRSLAAFFQDLGEAASDVVLVTMSEFGRTARQNGSRGTDHGHANVMFVVGGSVRGGKVYGAWPGLGDDQLHEGRDLAVTTDFRDVLGELVSTHLGNHSLETVFPGFRPAAGKRLNLLG